MSLLLFHLIEKKERRQQGQVRKAPLLYCTYSVVYPIVYCRYMRPGNVSWSLELEKREEEETKGTATEEDEEGGKGERGKGRENERADVS
jgi:hypothetical protein